MGIQCRRQLMTMSAPTSPLHGTETDDLSLRAIVVLKKATRDGERARPDVSLALTDRQWQIALLVLDGVSNKGIAAELGLACSTIRTHLARINEKCVRRNSYIAEKPRA
jgi:DNA-binding NarL/FixJ family response regulator